MRLTPAQREAIAHAAHNRYEAGETWAQIAVDYALHPQVVARYVRTYAPVTARRWGQQPIADPAVVTERRAAGRTLDQIAAELGCSRTAIRTALERQNGAPITRYPRLHARRAPTEDEVRRVIALYEACPLAARAQPNHRNVRGKEGAALAALCRTIVEDGVPMGTLSRAAGRGVTWVHRLLVLHDQQANTHPGRSTTRRTRTL